jgi:hypothetical protein
MDHLQACGHCPYIIPDFVESVNTACTVYTDLSWVNRRGGCPMFPERDLPEAMKKRVGQQKQKHNDKSYHSKNDGKRKYKYEV